MKQTVYYLKPAGDIRQAGGRGLGAIRDARARNVKVYFGLWLGLFAFTAVWACLGFARHGLHGVEERVWAQLVVLLAAVIFYLGARPLRHHAPGARMASLPVVLSLVACGLILGAAALHAGRSGLAPKPDAGFWAAAQNARFDGALERGTMVGRRTLPPPVGLAAQNAPPVAKGSKAAS